MTVPSQNQIEAAQLFFDTTLAALRNERGVHAETAIAATARMAGTFLFRSFGFEFTEAKAGQAVFSDLANDKGPRLVEILGNVLTHLGVTLDNARLSEAPGTDHAPLLSFLDTQKQLEPLYQRIKGRFGLSLEEAADATAIACALLINQCRSVLDPSIGFAIAAYGFVEGTKTAPAPYYT